MHSDNLTIQERSLPLFQNHTSEEVYKYAFQHKKIIARFGRFPHRNAILGRASTDPEIQFLKGPDLHSKYLKIKFTLFNRV